MRIVMLNHGYTGGGAERCVRELHQGLTQRGHDVQVWVANHQPGLPPGVRPITQPWERKLLPLDMLAHLTDWRHRGSIAALKTITPDTCDLLHVHSVSGGWMSIKVLQQACSRVPSIWTIHDEWALTNGFIYDLSSKIPKADVLPLMGGMNRLLGRSPYHDNFKNRSVGKLLDRYAPRQPLMIAPSQHMLRLIRQCPRFAQSDAMHLYHGVSMLDEPARQLSQEKARSRWDIPVDRQVVLMVAAHLYDVHKGITLGIDAISQLPEATRPAFLLLGKNADALANRLQGLEVVTGYASDNAALAAAYRAADVTLVPSLGEAMGFVCLESLACERPIIAFANDGPGEIIGDNQHGLTARPFDINDLAAKLQTLLSNAALRHELGQRGSAWVQSQCHMPAFLNRIEHLYQQTIERWR